MKIDYALLIMLTVTMGCATASGDAAMRASAAPENPEVGARVTPDELVKHEIRASVPIWWNRAMLVIVPTSCAGKTGRRFELALYEPDALEQTDAMSMVSAAAEPKAALYAAVEKLIAAMREEKVCFRHGVFLVRRDQNGEMRGEARYQPCEGAADLRLR